MGGGVRDYRVDLGGAHEEPDRESARVASQYESHWPVWVQANSFKTLDANYCVSDGLVHDEEVARVGSAGGQAGVEQDSVNHLQETRPCKVAWFEVEVARHAPGSDACVKGDRGNFEYGHVAGTKPFAFDQVS